MQKFLMAMGAMVLVGSMAAQADYSLDIEDNLLLYLGGQACNYDESGPVQVRGRISHTGGQGQLNLQFVGFEEETTIDCFGGVELGIGNPDNVHIVTVSSGSNGSIAPSSSDGIAVYNGQRLTFSVTPNSGYMVQSVSGTCGGSGTTTYTTNQITADCTVHASFVEQPAVVYSVTPSVSGNGTLNPSSVQQVPQGQSFSFGVAPQSGYELISISGCNGTLNGAGNTFSGTPTSNCTVTASFSVDAPVGVDLSACGNQWPSGITQGPTLNFSNPGSQVNMSLVGNTTVSMPFRTTTTSSLFGTFAFAATTGTTNITRNVWVSTCPSTTYASTSNACKSSGTEAVGINWAQHNKRASCQLQTDRQYFLNIRNTNCGSATNCAVYRILYLN